MLSLKMKRMMNLLPHFTVFYYYGNLCTATVYLEGNVCFFMQKSTQICFDDMESFS